MPHESTLSDSTSESGDRTQAPPHVLALVVAMCADEPERAGEIAIPPPGDPGAEVIWGRAGTINEDERRLPFQRHRPGRVTPRGEIASLKVSRAQLRLKANGDRELTIVNVGRAPLLHNGVEATEIEARPGDVIEIGKQVTLLVVRRPAWLPGPSFPGDFAFGAPDQHGIVGESKAAWTLRRSLEFVGPREGHVIIFGPSGAGKELVARAIHATSSRADRTMIARNAATLPEGLIDAELFGNVKNYPNPGMPERPGIVGEADRSTLFLDEIAEISPESQAHLLRLLDAGEYHRLGESRPRRADVRFLGATNRPESALKHDVRARFLLRVDVPGLDDRREDISLVANHVLREVAEKEPSLRERFFFERAGILYPRLSTSLVRTLLRRSYTTNVRELLSLLWEALAESPGDRIEPPARWTESISPRLSTDPRPSTDPPEQATTDPSVPGEDKLSPAAIQACLDKHNGVLEDAYRALNLSSRHALSRLVKKHGLEIRKRPR